MWKTQIMMVQLHAGIPSSLQVDQIRTNPSWSLLPIPKGFMAENQDHIYTKQLNLLVVGEKTFTIA